MKQIAFALLLVAMCAGCSDGGRTSSSTKPTSTADRDNTRVNERDRNSDSKTPINQNEKKSDVDITAKIRQQVVDTKMSINAQNVKIITQDGRVTLRGPVKSDEEKRKIEDIAKGVAGAGSVDNLIEVEANP